MSLMRSSAMNFNTVGSTVLKSIHSLFSSSILFCNTFVVVLIWPPFAKKEWSRIHLKSLSVLLESSVPLGPGRVMAVFVRKLQ